MSKLKRVCFSILCLACLITLSTLVAWQINQVNTKAPKAAIENYSLGEEIKLEGSFLESSSEENSEYSICVIKAERLSYNEYVGKYGLNTKKTKNNDNDKSIISVEMKITNAGNNKGSIDIYDMRLVPESKNTYYIPQETIWKKSEKNLTPWPNNISIEPGTSYTVHVPFTVNTDDEFITQGYIQGADFTLYLTDWPVSKRVMFSLDS